MDKSWGALEEEVEGKKTQYSLTLRTDLEAFRVRGSWEPSVRGMGGVVFRENPSPNLLPFSLALSLSTLSKLSFFFVFHHFDPPAYGIVPPTLRVASLSLISGSSHMDTPRGELS